jgi:hypothetical protein
MALTSVGGRAHSPAVSYNAGETCLVTIPCETGEQVAILGLTASPIASGSTLSVYCTSSEVQTYTMYATLDQSLAHLTWEPEVPLMVDAGQTASVAVSGSGSSLTVCYTILR